MLTLLHFKYVDSYKDSHDILIKYILVQCEWICMCIVHVRLMYAVILEFKKWKLSFYMHIIEKPHENG